jgi:K+-sensing histidine kinase KdpD
MPAWPRLAPLRPEIIMSRSAAIVDIPAPTAEVPTPSIAERGPLIVQYGTAIVAVVFAVAIGLGMQTVIPAANLTLLFVLPVMAVAILFGWGPSLFAALASALAFDFFFTEPKYSFAIASPADIWSTALLLLIGAIVSTLSAQLRRRALESRRAASQAEAIQALAHAVIAAAPRQQLLDQAAETLHAVLGAPAAILARGRDDMEVLASAGGARLSVSERGEAAVALDVHAPTQAGAYPTDRSRFDFWPVTLPSGESFVIAADFARAEDGRPKDRQRYVEAVSGYLAAALR